MKYFKPITPSLRRLILTDKSELWKGGPMKSLTVSKKSTGGRNNLGRITIAGRGKGVKQMYRIIDFSRSSNVKFQVVRIEYDPNRSSYIALVNCVSSNIKRYIIAPQTLNINSILENSNLKKIEANVGNKMLLKYIPIGCFIHNVEIKPGYGGQLSRSAGSKSIIISKNYNNALVKLCSGEIRIININCSATIGCVSNPSNNNINYGKAGRKRWLGFKPKVRGVAKNPIDHPHGGGEGKTSGGRHPVSKFAVLSKGYRTRNNKRTDKFILKHRYKK